MSRPQYEPGEGLDDLIFGERITNNRPTGLGHKTQHVRLEATTRRMDDLAQRNQGYFFRRTFFQLPGRISSLGF